MIGNDEAVSLIANIILLIIATVAICAVVAWLVFDVAPNISNGYENRPYNKGCELTKTSVIHIEERNGNNYVIDSDGCEYTWDGRKGQYDDYNWHNVTFSYNPNMVIHNHVYQITGVVVDHSSSCCNIQYNANSCGYVTPTPVPTPGCGCR